MTSKSYNPLDLTAHLYQLGTPALPVYLSMGEEGMLIEGGVRGTARMVVDQLKQLDIDPRKIKYLALTHSHPDHIGAVPVFKKIWPHLQVLGSPVAAKILGNPDLMKQFHATDLSIAQLMVMRNEIEAIPEFVSGDNGFEIDQIIKEGDTIDLGAGIVWRVYDAPGHAPCHLAFLEDKEKTLVLGDTPGFYNPDADAFWPNYFESLERYCDTIRKLAALPAERAVRSHFGMVDGSVRGFLEKAMKATEAFHNDFLSRAANDESISDIALSKGLYVASITNLQPIQVMIDMCGLMAKRSQKEKDTVDFSM